MRNTERIRRVMPRACRVHCLAHTRRNARTYVRTDLRTTTQPELKFSPNVSHANEDQCHPQPNPEPTPGFDPPQRCCRVEQRGDRWVVLRDRKGET